MTSKEFYTELAAAGFQGRLQSTGTIRDRLTGECPINYLARHKGHGQFSATQYPAAARALKLDRRLAVMISLAADMPTRSSKKHRKLLKAFCPSSN